VSARRATSDADLASSEIAQAVVKHCKLSPEQVGQISALTREEGLNFIDAALKLAIVSQDDIDDAIAYTQRTESRGRPSLIETALNKSVSRRTLPVLADAIPLIPSEQLVLAHDADDPRSERLRALRTEILLQNGAAAGPQSRAISLLSPSSGEGRSQLAAELAIAFSQLGRQTLLVDADLRNPRQHVLFNSDNRYGLSQALAATDTFKLQEVFALPSLRLLTSGPLPSNPLEMLSDGRMARFIASMRAIFEFIVIDTPPIDKYSDGLAIATAAGEVMVISRAQKTTHKAVRELLRRSAGTRAQVIGAVINHF
jgi:receptor protein-tyrosine kinase